MSYIIRVHFNREWSDDADIVERDSRYAGMTYREAFRQLFQAELQEAYDRSEGALAGHFEIQFVKAGPSSSKIDGELSVFVKSRKTRSNSLRAALECIKEARDYHAEHGEYPKGTLKKDQSFDDWAADVAEKALRRK